VNQTFSREPGRSVELLAEAEGHTSERRVIKFDQDWDIVLKLNPKPAAEPAASAMPGKRLVPPAAARAAPSQLAPRSQSDCVPPYFFDERGIKKYKPRCL
jgi:hypothetical protein